MRFTKSIAERYVFRGLAFGNASWAVFTVSTEDNSLSIRSDWGDWTYAWPAPGEKGIKHFLATMEKDYLLTKLSYGREVYLDIDHIRTELTKKVRAAFKEGSIGRWQMAEIKEYLVSELDSKTYSALPIHCPDLFDNVLGSDYESIPYKTMHEPGLEAMWLHAYIPFMEKLKEELNLEREQAI